MKKPIVYVAGPLTQGDVFANVNVAVREATFLVDDGRCIPFVPHLTALWAMISPQPYETWLEYDLALIEHCGALLRLPGHSPGADREVARCRELGIPVFGSTGLVLDWLDEQELPDRPGAKP